MSKTDKSTSTPGTPTTPIPPNVTKLCHIIKRENFDGYGFNLHSEKIKPGQFIGKVDPDSPALEAGLKEGDRIIEVNGVPIGNETHKQVVQRIKALSNEVRLLLIDVDGKGDVPQSPNKLSTPTKCCTTEQKSKMDGEIEEEKPVLPKTSPPATPVMLNGNGIAVDHNTMEYHGTKLELPGESANISSISMVSVKRMSSISSGSNHSSTMSADVVDKAMPASPLSVRSQPEIQEEINIKMDMPKPPMPDLTNGIIERESKTLIAMNNNNNNNMSMNMNSSNKNNNNIDKIVMPPLAPIIDPPPTMMTNVPPPPSSVTASNPNKNAKIMTSNGLVTTANGSTSLMSSNNNITPMNSSQTHSTTISSSTTLTSPSSAANSPLSTNSNGVNRAGSLYLPMTAAEMRAKLMSKKKYDPKQESVDLRKKFEIIQKL